MRPKRMPKPPPSLQQRQQEQIAPAGSPVMFQRWSKLAFAHWTVDPELVQASLPERLAVDTFDGQAWIGLVPFFMERIRPRFLPAAPGLSWFLEMNVRTYVYDRETGRPGVWFYSLDCNQPLAVMIARKFFHLPYFRARMNHRRIGEKIEYHCQRSGSSASTPLTYETKSAAECRNAAPGSLEFFLLERYLLFSSRPNGQLYVGQVNHPPYQFTEIEMQRPLHPALEQAGFPQSKSPSSVLFSPGVDVSVYPLERCN